MQKHEVKKHNIILAMRRSFQYTTDTVCNKDKFPQKSLKIMHTCRCRMQKQPKKESNREKKTL